MDDAAVIAEQQEFIAWLQSKGMYSGFESVQVMRKSMRVWQEMRKDAESALLATQKFSEGMDAGGRGWCGKCACPSCYEAQQKATDNW